MFTNEAFLDFTIAEIRDRFESALDYVDTQIKNGALYAAPIIAGKENKSGETLKSLDPSSPSTSVGTVYLANLEDAERAIESVRSGQRAWEETSFERRAEILRTAAHTMRTDKMRLAAIIVREAGKPWKEADGDVAEAIDFCDYYAEEMLRLGKPKKTAEVPGEDNQYFYQPRGVVAVIAPWNFPLAIACGMTVAGLVTGNSVILKPAEQSSIIAHQLAKILLDAGVPSNAFAFLPGYGETVGRHIVKSKDVDMICFTGSKAVGLEIIKTASQVQEGQGNIKKVVAELGGKNAIIIDEDADLDESVKGVLQSAFGFAGQKCSACSRVIVVGSAYENFISRLCEAAKDIIIGEAKEGSTFLGPVIDEEAQKRILRTIESAEKENSLAFKGTVPAKGYFVPPTIFRDVERSKSLWREEIFGPVVACARVKNFAEAIELANDSQYALTGGLFSRNPSNIAMARRQFRVGNLYINRGCTGALVCRQPFGGFKMSGVGSKAGGPDYLIQFMEPRSVTENTMRRGFAPE